MRRVILLLVVVGLMAVAAFDAQAAFPGRNGRIAFAGGGRDPHRLLSVRPDGSGRRVIARKGFEPAFSRSGRQLAFTTGPGSDRGGAYIDVAGSKGRGRRRLTRGLGYDHSPSWSPDGRHLAFVRGDPCIGFHNDEQTCPPRLENSTDQGILVYAGGRARVVSSDGYSPSWSPDGKWIAFVRNGGPVGAELLVMRPDGSERRTLFHLDNGDVNSPDWSPDGRWIVFGVNEPPDFLPETIAAIRSDGSGFHRLGHGGSPSYSPNGRQIVYLGGACRGRGFSARLWRMAADGRHRHRFRSSSGRQLCGSAPTWQPLP